MIKTRKGQIAFLTAMIFGGGIIFPWLIEAHCGFCPKDEVKKEVVTETKKEKEVGTIVGIITAAKKKDMENVVVYLADIKGTFAPPAKHASVNQKDVAFIPEVKPILVGTEVDFLNEDKTAHNVHSRKGDKSVTVFNIGMRPTGEVATVKFDQPGVVRLRCNVHADMKGFLVVLPHPYFAVTDKQGRFTITGVPPGNYTLTTWHEKEENIGKATASVNVLTGKTTEVTLALAK